MKINFITIIRQLTGCLIFFVFGCDQSPAYKKLVVTKGDSIANETRIKNANAAILLAAKNIQTGYLITRTGNDFTSESLRSLNRRNTTYSHCGIASIENDTLFVYHALGGEWNPDQKIRRDPFIYFADPNTNKGIGIFSFEFPDETKKKLIAVVQDLYHKGIMFDMKFDLETDDRMYCAEFVYKCLERGTDGKLKFDHSHIKDFEFIGVDDIFLHKNCMLKQEIVYK